MDHEIKSLLGICIDFEVDLYDFVLKKIQNEGLTLSFSHDINKYGINFDQPLDYKNVCSKPTGVFYFLLKKKEHLRSTVICPYFTEVFYSDDIIVVSKISDKRINIKLLKKSVDRIQQEKSFYNSEQEIENSISSIYEILKGMLNDELLLSHDNVNLLKALKIIDCKDKFGYLKKERKVIQAYVHNTIKEVVESKSLIIKFDCIGQYLSLVRGRIGSFDVWKEAYNNNITFWEQSEILDSDFSEKWLAL